MPKSIGKAFKMSFMQVVPGEEINVANALDSICKNDESVEDYVILKGLGCYDIVFIFASKKGFDSHLSKFGPIKGIVRTSRFFCFQYELNDDDFTAFFVSLRNNAFTTISLIKLSPWCEHQPDEINKVLEYCTTNDKMKIKTGHAFGTLGWVDVAMIKSSDNIEDLLFDTFWSFSHKESIEIYKTYSSVLISHNKLPNDNTVLKDERRLIDNFNQYHELRAPIHESIDTKIYITHEPGKSQSIYDYWISRNYHVVTTTGRFDCCVRPGRETSFAELLAHLIYFRSSYQEDIESTETKLDLFFTPQDMPVASSKYKTSSIDYDYSKLEYIFGETQALSLAGNINALNGLLQNKIISDAFADLVDYFDYIIETGKKIKESQARQEERIPFANKCSFLIKRGAELRLYGTHGTFEESVGHFTKLRGGVQKSLLAMEFLPEWIIKRVTQDKYTWSGFVVTGSREFLHLNEVIIVPYESLWKPKQWWAIYHEMAHILINNLPDMLDYDLPEIQMFLARKNIRNYWFYLVNEIAAEIVGYELGFFGDYELYMKLVWNYLTSLSPEYDKISPFSVYFVRTFFVKMYERMFVQHTIGPEDLDNFNLVYDEMLKHIVEISDNYFIPKGRSLDFENSCFIAAENARLFKELYPWLENRLNKFSNLLGFRCSDVELDLPNTNDVITSIQEGQRWNGTIASPEAVLYRFLKTNEVKFEEEMAFILTFWNQYRLNRG